MTCAATWSTDSHSTGLTFPGMMEDPGCVSGRWISPIPQRGPDASQRKSLAIFIKLTASDFKLPLMCTAASRAHLGFEMILRFAKRQPEQLRNPGDRSRCEFRVRV